MDGGFTLLKQNDRHVMNGRSGRNKNPFHAQQASKMKHSGVYVPVRRRKKGPRVFFAGLDRFFLLPRTGCLFRL